MQGWTREAVLSGLKRLASELGRTPTVSDLAGAPSYCPSMDAVARVCGSLVRALRDAGLVVEAGVKKKQRWTAKRCLEALRLATAELRRAPTVGDVARLRRAGADLPSVTSLRRRFGSFPAALAAAGVPRPLRATLPGLREAAMLLERDPAAGEAMRAAMGEKAFEAFVTYVRCGRLRDTGVLLGVSKQRVHKLIAEAVERWTKLQGSPWHEWAEENSPVRARVDPEWGLSLVRLERTTRGLTQEELARGAGVSARTVRRAEELQAIKRSTAEVIADFFGRSVEEMFEPCAGAEGRVPESRVHCG